MPSRRTITRWLVAAFLVTGWPAQYASATTSPIRVVVSFSILKDIVQEVGGTQVVVSSLIGPDSDAHVFEPSPDHARLLARAQLLIVNGLGFEGWLTRLTRSAEYRGPIVVATKGITPLPTNVGGNAGSSPDPHAWQNVNNGVVYAENIAQALAGVDPAHAEAYRERFRRYKADLETLDRRVRDLLGAIPADKRRVITNHDAFAYYGRAYGISFLAPEGVNTEAEPSAKAIAELIRQIRREGIKALFLENISDPRLVEELAREADTTTGPPLYSDALSPPGGPAPSYVRMIEYNTAALKQGMLKN
jgi:zinc/manganese transport system substrate-binding protein